MYNARNQTASAVPAAGRSPLAARAQEAADLCPPWTCSVPSGPAQARLRTPHGRPRRAGRRDTETGCRQADQKGEMGSNEGTVGVATWHAAAERARRAAPPPPTRSPRSSAICARGPLRLPGGQQVPVASTVGQEGRQKEAAVGSGGRLLWLLRPGCRPLPSSSFAPPHEAKAFC
jgi:hypothetical protein